MSSFEVAWGLAKDEARMFPKDICNDCGIDVSRGSGISVNRIPADTIQGLYPGGFEQFVDDRQGYGILSRYNPETLRWIYENPSEVDTGWRCALCEVDAYADMEAPDHPEVEDGLWNTALAMDLSSKNTLHYQEFMERFGHLKEHHPDVFNMIEQRLDILGEDGSDFQASATPFEAGWDSITKAPWIVDGTMHPKMPPMTVEGPLYSGGDISDTPRYWTNDFNEALAYALFGSAIPVRGLDDTFSEQVPMRETIPAIWVAQDPGYNWQVKEPGERFGFERDAEELWEEGDDLRNYILQQDPMSEAYMHDPQWGAPINEKMSEDKMRNLLLSLIEGQDDVFAWGNTGAYKTADERKAHIKAALERFDTGRSGRLWLDDMHKPLSQTSETDFISESDDEEYLREWGRWDE